MRRSRELARANTRTEEAELTEIGVLNFRCSNMRGETDRVCVCICISAGTSDGTRESATSTASVLASVMMEAYTLLMASKSSDVLREEATLAIKFDETAGGGRVAESSSGSAALASACTDCASIS